MKNKRYWRGQLDKYFEDHYSTLTEKPHVFIEANLVDNGLYTLNMTNLVLLFIYEKFNFKEMFLLTTLLPSTSKVEVDLEQPLITYRSNTETLEPMLFPSSGTPVGSEDIKSCQRPAVLITEKQEVISGLTSVLRFLLKYSISKSGHAAEPETSLWNSGKVMENLLGYRGGCLAACSGTSTWTKFCEVEMSQRMISALMATLHTSRTRNQLDIPEDLVRLECHLAQPLSNRSNNAKKKNRNRQRLSSSSLSEDLAEHQSSPDSLNNTELSHDYAEGPDVMLSDVILFPAVHLAITTLGEDIFTVHLPKVTNWYQRVKKFLKNRPNIIGEPIIGATLEIQLDNIGVTLSKTLNCIVNIPDVPRQCLSKSDPELSKFMMREYTKQDDIDSAINFLKQKGIEPLEYFMEEGSGNFLNWDEVPLLIHPEGGNLPESRRIRKGHQLASLLNMVKIVHDEIVSNVKHGGSTIKIVDFCSGGGHLGILVAWSLPNAQVVLVENKEESLRRAQDRVQKIGLKNIKFFQCNLTSYVGDFDIGMALHACGSATDLVLKKCEEHGAAFVISPCCYGSIHPSQCPRSPMFLESGLAQSQYLVLAHSSDQTHHADNAKTSQGYHCMRIIDTDRLARFGELGYRSWVTRMAPETASPKNHILVGVPHNDSFK